jgi:hypothetical protein
MKAILPKPQHFSYKAHRKQVVTQIILPVAVAGLLMIALIVLISLSTFRGNGDAGRWAAISTIWIVIPIMLAGLIFLALLIGLIYLFARLLGILPAYTGKAQDYAYKARGYIVRGADMAVKPIIALEVFLENVRAFFGRK